MKYKDSRLDPITGLKKCLGCGQQLTPEHFYRDRTRPDGLCLYCKRCRQERKTSAPKSPEAIVSRRNRWKRWAKQQHNQATLKRARDSYARSVKGRLTQHRRRALLMAADDGTVTLEVLAQLYARWNGICPRCGRRRRPSLDHRRALSRGGLHSADNLQLMCRNCNSSKREFDK